MLAGTVWWSIPGAAGNPVRQTKILVPYTRYEWWMIAWETNEILCQIFIDHEGLPTPDEAAESCGQEYANIWVATKPCNDPSGSSCNGVYVHLASTQPSQKEVTIELPSMEVWVDLDGCTPVPPENRCPTIPSLLITAKEPLPNEQIISIQGLFDGVPFECQGSECLLPLQATPLEGLTVEFWANSSYGDTSAHYTALVRVLDTGVSTVPGNSGWYVDVISTQWVGTPLASCARIWEAFPSIGTSTEWLVSAGSSQLIASADPYFYLAGRLIAQHQVDASDCPSGGLLPNGYANACGIEKARPLLVAWQNQFDQSIIVASRGTGVPAQLLKNLFAQESQFWPGIFRVRYELGLGQLTDQGVDSIFLWNPEFYNQFCPLVLSPETCQPGYLRLDEEQRALLRGALAAQAGVDCASCPAGVDLSKTSDSVLLFAQALVANCSQVDQTIYTATRLKSGLVASYEDLWRFTVANYHAGPGCLSYAIHVTWQGIPPLTWEAASANFTPACQGVVPYVTEIAP
jgi:hypothetical protein